MSDYDDPFVVVLDERTADESRLDPGLFASHGRASAGPGW